MDLSIFAFKQYIREPDIHKDLARSSRVGIVEVGVLFGDTTRIFLQNTDVPVIGIDPIVPDSMNKLLIGDVGKIRALEREFNNFLFIQDYSYNVVGKVPPFDYIFIDGDHTYDAVRRDFVEWYPYLAQGGVMAFHDSAANRGGPSSWPGPSEVADRIIDNGFMKHLFTVDSLTVFQK